VARAVISDSRGTLAEQLDHRAGRGEPRLPAGHERASASGGAPRPPRNPAAAASPGSDPVQRPGRLHPDGREYVITLPPGQVTPAPWVNVLANPHFGTCLGSGSAYTWSENAHEFRLTPWHNDPVSDASGEALYLRDEETGHFWSPTPLPARRRGPYVTRHGFGYSVFETREDGIAPNCGCMWRPTRRSSSRC
jgi:cyclic beta-1,2-glucan synthetase